MKMREIINLVEHAQTAKPRLWFLSNEMIDEDIIAYHGTPHDFDKFDISKIGTGEGAQAFGHGLYFADNEEVAKSYRDNISYQQSIKNQGWSAPDGLPPDQAADAIKYMSGFWGQFDPDYILKSARETAAELKQAIQYRDQLEERLSSMPPELLEKWPKMVENLSKDLESANRSVAHCELAARVYPILQKYGVEAFVPKGSLFQVRIKADPDDFLDWDTMINKQNARVQEFFKDVPQSPDIPGRLAYYRMAGKKLQSPETSQAMLAAGIPGIKYLDGGSRQAGEGSRNYVVFDDDLVEIIRKE